MKVVFNKEINICDASVGTILSERGKKAWSEAYQPKEERRKLLLKVDDKRRINKKKGTITNLLLLLTYGCNTTYVTVRTRVSACNDEAFLESVDSLFKRTAPVYIDFDQFNEFLSYSGRLVFTENDKIILHAMIKHEAWKTPITIDDIYNETDRVSTKIKDRLQIKRGAEETPIEKRLRSLKKNDFIIDTENGYQLNLEKLIVVFNDWRNYPEEP